VTVAQFRRFVAATGYQTVAETKKKGWVLLKQNWQEYRFVNWRSPGFEQQDDCPVVVISWDDAQEFVKWATKLSGLTVRLPTEAEWEYAARGPRNLQYSWGNNWDGMKCNHADVALKNSGIAAPTWRYSKDDDGAACTSSVGHYGNASWCGAYDMAGNAWQWCQDWYDPGYYATAPAADPTGPETGTQRVMRGGSWYDDPAACRSTYRGPAPADFRFSAGGFRVVVEQP
jgi:formylglycine-generating enzyme